MHQSTPVDVDVSSATRGLLRVTVDHEGKTRIEEKYVVSSPLPGRAAACCDTVRVCAIPHSNWTIAGHSAASVIAKFILKGRDFGSHEHHLQPSAASGTVFAMKRTNRLSE